MIKDWFWETAGFGEKSRLACCSLKRCRDQMIAAGKSKFWQIKLKEESNHLRIESKWAQFDLEPFILHLIEWHKKVISFSEWRHFQINYPSNQRPTTRCKCDTSTCQKRGTRIVVERSNCNAARR